MLVTGNTAYIGHRPNERLGYYDGYMSSALLFDVMLTRDDISRARRYVLRRTNIAGMCTQCSDSRPALLFGMGCLNS
jgi:hypothetical protein